MLTLNFDPYPLLATERLSLRLITLSDAPEIFALRTDDRVLKFIGKPKLKNLDEARELIESRNSGIAKNESILWGITLKNENKIIGTICLRNIAKEHSRAEIGYELLPGLHGKGLMQEAIAAVLDYGFNTIRLHTVAGNVAPENAASIKLLERNGFLKEAHFRENFRYPDGRFGDTAVY